MSTTRKTDPQLAAAIKAIFEMQKRVRELEVMAEGLLAQGRGHSQALDRLEATARQNGELLSHLKTTSAHVMRLLRQKEVLLELAGRAMLERQAGTGEVGEFEVNVLRALKEMRGEH